MKDKEAIVKLIVQLLFLKFSFSLAFNYLSCSCIFKDLSQISTVNSAEPRSLKNKDTIKNSIKYFK